MQKNLQATVDPGLAVQSMVNGLAPRLPPALGFEPIGAESQCPGCNPAEIPQTTDELSELLSYSYDLTVSRAGELNIPIAGTVSGGFDRRVVVYEWTRYKEIAGAEGLRCRFGYVIRFCLTVSKWEAQAKLSLPFLSAQAELGNLQASWLMQVRGLVGPKIDAVVLPPQELKVETFVIARQSLVAVIGAISDPTTQFRPGILVARVDPTTADATYWRAAVQSFSIDSVRRSRTRSEAIGRLGSTNPSDADILGQVYEYFGLTDPNAKPGAGAREQAQRLLRGIRVDR